jgi:uncharacterized protein (DUF983 family)
MEKLAIVVIGAACTVLVDQALGIKWRTNVPVWKQIVHIVALGLYGDATIASF